MSGPGVHRWTPADREMPGLESGVHVHLLTAALVTEADAQRRLLQGDAEGARDHYRAAAAEGFPPSLARLAALEG